jgi:predicted GIY-YIG superfamily endonuclease
VYVIRLDPKVLTSTAFRSRNPQYRDGKPCAYVGRTGRTPEERFKQHKEGYKANRFARRYGLYLMRRQFERKNPMTYEDSMLAEVALAERLRAKGWAVWQG